MTWIAKQASAYAGPSSNPTPNTHPSFTRSPLASKQTPTPTTYLALPPQIRPLLQQIPHHVVKPPGRRHHQGRVAIVVGALQVGLFHMSWLRVCACETRVGCV